MTIWTAGGGGDTAIGGAGNDDIQGGDGNDRLYGNGGADTLDGGAGIDKIYGGRGSDDMFGGTESDIFFYLAGDLNGGAVDTISDYAGGDFIDLSDILNVASAAQIANRVDRIGNDIFIDIDGPSSNTFVSTLYLVTSGVVDPLAVRVDGFFASIT